MILLALLLTAAQACADIGAVPTVFCVPALDVAAATDTCAGNGTFVSAAEQCGQKLEALETKLGAEAQAIAAVNANSQNGEVHRGTAEYDYSQNALRYLIAVAKVGLNQLEAYPEYIFLPADRPMASEYDRLKNARTVGCYRDAELGVLAGQKFFHDKIARFELRLAESRKHDEKLKVTSGALGNLGRQAASTKAAGAGVKGGKSPNPSSSITGVDEDAAKRAKK